MTSPATPQNEKKRLQSLRGLNLLDTPKEERFDRITRLAHRLFQVPYSALNLIDGDRQWGKSCHGIQSYEVSREHSFCAHTILQEDPMVIPDTHDDERFVENPQVTGDPGIRFYAGVPVHSPDGHRVGTLCVFDQQPREVSNEDIKSLGDLAVLVENELTFSELSDAQSQLKKDLSQAEKQAATDNLTGLWNRRATKELLTRELDKFERDGSPFSVALLDLDHFKDINDSYGHAAGDYVLRKAAKRINTSVRPQDSVGRWGGEEFLVILEETSRDEARTVCERIRDHFRNPPFTFEGETISVTISIGLADYRGESDSEEELIKRADEALYRCKDSGRNAVVC